MITGPLCGSNKDCIDTTFCCSTNQCVHPTICLNGGKGIHDYCDYKFECKSQCCSKGVCTEALDCYSNCAVNAGCPVSNCCSEGFCSNSIICEGLKLQGDYCDENSECAT